AAISPGFSFHAPLSHWLMNLVTRTNAPKTAPYGINESSQSRKNRGNQLPEPAQKRLSENLPYPSESTSMIPPAKKTFRSTEKKAATSSMIPTCNADESREKPENLSLKRSINQTMSSLWAFSEYGASVDDDVMVMSKKIGMITGIDTARLAAS